MSTRKTLYKIYPTLTRTSIRAARKALPRRERKLGDRDILARICALNPHFLQSVDFFVFAEELYWDKSGRRAIFPESADMVRRLIDAHFDYSRHAIFAPPFESFILAMPAGIVIEGVELPSCLVTYGSFAGFAENYRMGLCAHLQIPRPEVRLEPGVSAGALYISIAYRDALNPDCVVQLGITSDQWPQILLTPSYSQYQGMVRDYEVPEGAPPLSASTREDSIIQFNLVRLIAAMSIYHSATDGQHLHPGLPGKAARPKMLGSPEDLPRQIHHLWASDAMRTASDHTGELRYHRMHFRNLRDERYYRGEHRRLARGSRWVMVSDYVTNQTLQAHTLDAS